MADIQNILDIQCRLNVRAIEGRENTFARTQDSRGRCAEARG